MFSSFLKYVHLIIFNIFCLDTWMTCIKLTKKTLSNVISSWNILLLWEHFAMSMTMTMWKLQSLNMINQLSNDELRMLLPISLPRRAFSTDNDNNLLRFILRNFFSRFSPCFNPVRKFHKFLFRSFRECWNETMSVYQKILIFGFSFVATAEIV